jgi:uncharacterized protein (TIGR03437 family)
MFVWLVLPGSSTAQQSVLTISKTHTGNFAEGQTNAVYTVAVSNQGFGTSGTVTVTEKLPAGLTLVSMAGAGWTCPSGGTSCSRSDALAAGASYPPITITVNVASNAPSQVTNQVAVSGGGSVGASASDTATILGGAPLVSGVLNGASYVGSISPGTWIAIFGTNLAPSVASAQSVPLPTQLNGVSVSIGQLYGSSIAKSPLSAPLSYVSPTQINALVPFEVGVGYIGNSFSVVMPVVVTSGSGASAPFYVQLVSAEAPGLFTQNGAGTGRALLFDSSFQPVGAVGQVPLILYAAGLGPTNPPASSASGGNSTEPLNWVVNPVDVYVGDSKATVLFAGLAPGFPGVYQLNVQPNGAMTDRIYLRSGFWQSNIAQVGIAAGNSVSNVTGSIAGLYPPTDNLPSTYRPPGTMRPVSISAMLFAAVFNARFDIARNAQPFDLVATTEAATAVIHFDTQQGVYTATLTVPTPAGRNWVFSSNGQWVFSCGTPTPSQGATAFPGNIVPTASVDPVAAWALRYLPPAAEPPCVPTGGLCFLQGPNTTVVTTGTFTPGTAFVVDANNHPELSTFGGFVQIPCAGPGPTSRTTAFSLYLDGRLVASKTGTYNVAQ